MPPSQALRLRPMDKSGWLCYWAVLRCWGSSLDVQHPSSPHSTQSVLCCVCRLVFGPRLFFLGLFPPGSCTS